MGLIKHRDLKSTKREEKVSRWDKALWSAGLAVVIFKGGGGVGTIIQDMQGSRRARQQQTKQNNLPWCLQRGARGCLHIDFGF